MRRRPIPFAELAAAWSLLYTVAAVFWALGGGGFPFGHGDAEASDMGSLFVGLSPQALAPPIAAISATGAVAALAMARPNARRLPRRAVLALGWTMTVLLALGVPDVRLLRDFAYLVAGGVGFVDHFDWPTANQLLCLAAGAAWAAATVRYQRVTRPAQASGSALERAPDEQELWARRGRALTLAAVLLPLPYELTRWAWALGWPIGVSQGAEIIEQASAAERIGMFAFATMPLLGGLLTHSLTQRWGEAFPRPLPWLGGRTVPVGAVAVPAGLVSILITTAAASLFRIWLNETLGRTPPATPDIAGWGAWAPGLLWLPWGLTLAGATYAYWRRRKAQREAPAGVLAPRRYAVAEVTEAPAA